MAPKRRVSEVSDDIEKLPVDYQRFRSRYTVGKRSAQKEQEKAFKAYAVEEFEEYFLPAYNSIVPVGNHETAVQAYGDAKGIIFHLKDKLGDLGQGPNLDWMFYYLFSDKILNKYLEAKFGNRREFVDGHWVVYQDTDEGPFEHCSVNLGFQVPASDEGWADAYCQLYSTYTMITLWNNTVLEKLQRVKNRKTHVESMQRKFKAMIRYILSCHADILCHYYNDTKSLLYQCCGESGFEYFMNILKVTLEACGRV